jgi:hypothetical protein
MTDYYSIPSQIKISKSNVKNGYIHGYDNIRIKDENGEYNPNNVSRIDQFQSNINISDEIFKQFDGLGIQYIYYNGYNNDPNIIMLVSKTALTQDQQDNLHTVIANHKNNLCVNWCVKLNDGTFLEVEGEPQIFDNQNNAQIIANQYEEAIVVGVVIL